MKTTKSALVTKAAPERMWEALTVPSQVKLWQYGSELITDWKPGSPIRFRNEWQGQVFEQWGTVLSFEAPHRLSYSLFFPRPGLEDRPENYFTMSYELRATSAGTELVITQDDPRPAADEPAEDGESPILAALRALVEA